MIFYRTRQSWLPRKLFSLEPGKLVLCICNDHTNHVYIIFQILCHHFNNLHSILTGSRLHLKEPLSFLIHKKQLLHFQKFYCEVMTNLDSILKIRDITLPTKVHIVKVTVFPIIIYVCATERLPFHFSLSCIGEGNGNPLQCSCLENPRDEGAWWAAVCGVTQSRT